ASLLSQYNHWTYIRTQTGNMQMDLINQPNVAGWPAFYQSPQFYEMWINSDTLPKRNLFTDTLVNTGRSNGGLKIIVDPIAFTQQFSNVDDPNLLIGQASALLFPFAITD